jgi:phosphoglycolate phosphatase
MALARMGYAAGPEVWYLGDTALDMKAAHAAGVTAVLVGDASHDGGVELAAADIHVHSAHELAAWLKSLA